MQSLTFRPHPRVRAVFVGLAVFGMLVPLPPLLFGFVPGRFGRHAVVVGPDRWIAGLVIAVLTTCPLVLAALQTLRAGVWVTNDTVVVRGLIATRRIPRSAAVGLTDAPAIHYRDTKGRDRFAAMSMFGSSRIRVVREHNTSCLERLERVLFPQEASQSRGRRARKRRRGRAGRPRSRR